MSPARLAPHYRIAAVAVVALAARAALAHHEITAKFDDMKPATLAGLVTAVDWRNPHVHVFINVAGDAGTVSNWAIELESTIKLEKSGWSADTLEPGDRVTVVGPVARDGTRQIWGETLTQVATGHAVLYARDTAPIAPAQPRPAPRGPDGHPRLGALDTEGGYWGYPTSSALVQDGARVALNAHGLLASVGDAARVAPFQPWALGLYQYRQQRHLRDDPMFLNCKPPGGVRYLQSEYGIQLVEDHERQRVFVLIGGGNHNYRIIYLDGRTNRGQVRGDDDNPLYYGRSTGRWEGDTLVVETAGFNEDFWFTNGGLPHTSQLHLTERFSRPDFDTLRYEVTIDDPGAYTKPWSAHWDLRWVGGEELPVYFCQDNRS
jgi:Family of unknown function (DUF6152)